MITNTKRALFLTVMYSAFGIAGLICSLIDHDLKYALLFNAVNGLFAISCFKRLKLNAFIKLGLFAVGIIAVIKLYTKFIPDDLESMFLSLFALLSNIVGLLVILISKATLERSKTYFLLNLIIMPLSLIASMIFCYLSTLVGIVISVIIGGIVLSFIWYAGGAPRYESEHIYYQYETDDGRILTHSHDNCYTDGCGGYYELSSDGETMSEL